MVRAECARHENTMVGATKRIVGLDVLRGFAALTIVVYHCNALMNLQRWPAYTDYLSLAVQIFFALSAFSLCLRYQGRLEGAGNIADFYIRRYLRIAPLFYAMMLLAIGRRIYKGWDLPSLQELALNLSFLFPFVPGNHESLVAAGWSLGLEMMFYVMFPLIAAYVLNLRQAGIWFVTAIVIQCLAGYWLYSEKLTQNFYWMAFPVQLPFFLVGVVVFHLFKKVDAWPMSSRASLAIATVIATPALLWVGWALGIYEMRIDGWPVFRPIVGYLLAPLVFAFAIYSFPLIVNGGTVYLGEISYGVYLIHPLMIRLVGMPVQKALSQAGIGAVQSTVLVIGAVLAATIVMASLSYRWLERPMMQLRGRAVLGKGALLARWPPFRTLPQARR